MLSLSKREIHLIFNFQFLILKVAEQRRTSRTPKGKAPQPVTDYGRIQPQAPELEEAVLGHENNSGREKYSDRQNAGID